MAFWSRSKTPTAGTMSPASPWSDSSTLNTISAALLADLFGTPADDGPIDRATAMSLAVVARARTVLCATGGRLPLEVITPDGVSHDSAYAFIANPECDPDVPRPGYQTYLWIIDAQIFYGRAWLVVRQRYADTGRIRSLEWVPEWRALLEDDWLIGHTDGRRFPASDVVRIDGPHEGVLAYGRRELRTALRLERAALSAADNPVPMMVLQEQSGVTERLTREEIDEVLDTWVTARRKGRNVGYAPSSLKPEAMGTPVENLLVEGRKYSAGQLCRVMGVPAWVADVPTEGSSITYTNVASRSRELVEYALFPYLAAIEARMSADDILPRGVWCRYNFDALLRGDFGDRMTAYKTAIDARIYTPDELRAREDLTPTEPTPEET